MTTEGGHHHKNNNWGSFTMVRSAKQEVKHLRCVWGACRNVEYSRRRDAGLYATNDIFPLACENYWRRFDKSFPTCTTCLFFFFFFFEWRSAGGHQCVSFSSRISLVSVRNSTIWGDCGGWVACELVSLMGSHNMPRQRSQLSPTSLVKGVCMFVCNPPPAQFGEMTGVFCVLLR